MKYTVIVAEDEELLLNNLVQKIQKADPDFQVAGTAQTGDQALALIEQLSPDLVVTDIRMPVMDGITLLSRVREQFPFTKFIITSGFSDFEYARKAITLKASDYLLKPVDPGSGLQSASYSCSNCCAVSDSLHLYFLPAFPFSRKTGKASEAYYSAHGA